MKNILLVLSLLLLAATACSSQENPIPTPETNAVSQATDILTPAQTDGEKPPAATTTAPATAGATATPIPTPHPGDALATEITSRAATPEPPSTPSDSGSQQPQATATTPVTIDAIDRTTDSSANPTPDQTADCPQGPPDNPQQNQTDLLDQIYACLGQDYLERNYALDRPDLQSPFRFPIDESQANLRSTEPSRFGITDIRNLFPLNVDSHTIGTRIHRVATPIHDRYKDHPYIHLFPHLQWSLRQSEAKVGDYYPHVLLRQIKRHDGVLPVYHGIEHFLANPWFEPVDLNEFTGYADPHFSSFGRQNIGPNWFGGGSLRQVIASALANELENRLIKPVEDKPIPFPNSLDILRGGDGRPKYEPDPDGLAYTTNLQHYLQTPYYITSRHVAEKILTERAFYPDHEPPTVSWELVSDNLPIVQVTAWGRINLPYALPDVECDRQEYGGPCGPTIYAVSFVVAFQNRWNNWNEPNRWIHRLPETAFAPQFGNNLPDLLNGSQWQRIFNERYGAVESAKATYAQQWHHTDYMHHSLIGPIALQIIESPVLKVDQEPTFIQPTKSVWHNGWSDHDTTLPDQILMPSEYLIPWQGNEQPAEYGKTTFIPFPVSYATNPGFPLPGHVLTNPSTGPGTLVWQLASANGELEDYLSSWNDR